jgi:uncharacterized protein
LPDACRAVEAVDDPVIEALSSLQIAFAALVVFAAFVVRGMTGFGVGMVAIPLLVFVLPIHTAVPAMGLLVFLLLLFLTVRDWREVVWGELKLLVPPTLLGVLAGTLLFANLESALLLKLLALFIMSYALYAVVVHYFGLPELTCSRRWSYPMGFVGACIDTIFGGGGGTLVVIYLHMRRVGRVQFRATVSVLWFLELIARMLGYAMAGLYTARTVLLCALLLPLVWAGTHVGERIGNRISQETFTRVVAALLFLAGVTLLLKSA